MKLAIPKESRPDETRVAATPETVKKLIDLGFEVTVEKGAGTASSIPDAQFKEAGAKIAKDAATALGDADVVLKVLRPTTGDGGEVGLVRSGAVLAAIMNPIADRETVDACAAQGLQAFAMELMPRITRAQSMDVLSSQAAVAGYKAVLLAANLSGRFFPMLTTAAGTIRPAKTVVIGAGVAGLQAIATARRLGAIVEGYDVRAATKEQVESLGAKFIDIDVAAEGSGGYARELTEEEKQQQQAILAEHIAAADVVITTAALPGRPSPKIIPASMVEAMKPGAVIVDLAAEGGGNCELTRAGEQISHNGITVYGPLDVPSMLAVHASEMYAKNLLNFLTPMTSDGEFTPDWEDEVISESVLTHQGVIRHEPTRAKIEGDAS